MIKRSIPIFFTFIFLSLTGCDQFQKSPNTVVLDLDAIANATGQAAIIKKQIEIANKDLTSQLTEISSKLNEQLAAEKKKIGKKPTKNDTQNMQQLTMQANQKMQQAKAIASQKSQQYQAALIQQLRKSVMPIAEKIALERNADIVSIVDNSMIWFNPDVDITDEVIAEVRAQRATNLDSTQATTTETSESDKK